MFDNARLYFKEEGARWHPHHQRWVLELHECSASNPRFVFEAHIEMFDVTVERISVYAEGSRGHYDPIRRGHLIFTCPMSEVQMFIREQKADGRYQ